MPETPDSAAKPANPAPPILIIDDDRALLMSLALLLETQGYRVLQAADGLSGLDVFRKERPAVVITDIIMPEQDGIGTIMTMRREVPDVKIIAMSGGGRIGKSDFLTVARKLGADATLAKPGVADQVIPLLQKLLGRA